ncbi:MAG TPA: DUF6491 family protein [Gammaproteobacteria bacterium]
MRTSTNRVPPTRWLAALLASTAFAAGVADASSGEAEPGIEPAAEIEIDAAPELTSLVPVDSIPALGRLHSWSVVDDDRLIIWATPFRPYLVELFRPSPELKFAVSIGVTSFGSRIHARFDSVEVDGFSYPIRRIYEMSRDDAEALKASS